MNSGDPWTYAPVGVVRMLEERIEEYGYYHSPVYAKVVTPAKRCSSGHVSCGSAGWGFRNTLSRVQDLQTEEDQIHQDDGV